MPKFSLDHQPLSRALRIASLVFRITQACSSLIVTGLLYYIFLGLHRHQLFFLLLSAAGHFTLLQLIAIAILGFAKRLTPLAPLGCNGASFVLWGAGLAGLTFYDWKHQLLVRCSGHQICTMYKILFIFALVGTISTLLALLLDIYLFRRARWDYKNLQRHPHHAPPRIIYTPTANGKDEGERFQLAAGNDDGDDDDDDDDEGMEMIAPLRSPSPLAAAAGERYEPRRGEEEVNDIGERRSYRGGGGGGGYNAPMVTDDMDEDDIAYHGRRNPVGEASSNAEARSMLPRE